MDRSLPTLIADAEPLSRLGFIALLKRDLGIKQAIEADSFGGVIEALTNFPSIQLMAVDLELPGLHQSAGIAQLRAHYPSVKLVVLAASVERNAVLEVLSAGAHGFIPKSLSPEEMSDAFKGSLLGNIYVPLAVSGKSNGPATPPRRQAPNLPELTDRQCEVIALLTSGKSNKQIARDLNISESTVKVHLNASFRVLGVHNRVSAAAVVEKLTKTGNIR